MPRRSGEPGRNARGKFSTGDQRFLSAVAQHRVHAPGSPSRPANRNRLSQRRGRRARRPPQCPLSGERRAHRHHQSDGSDSTYGWLSDHADKQGSVNALVDLNSGNVVEKYSYDAFGKPTITDAMGNLRSTSAVGNRFMFQGREWISELGIYDYRHRMY